jgi:hypothetical protein
MSDGTVPPEPNAPEPGFDLPSEVSAFAEAFPKLFEHVTFVDVDSAQILCADANKHAAALARFRAEGPEGQAFRNEYLASREFKTSRAWSDGQGEHFVFVYANEDQPRFLGPSVPFARYMRFVLNHELGHILVPEGGSDNRLLAETAADAYALALDFARYRDTSLAEAALLFRTTWALFNEQGILNFSSPAIENMLENGEKIVAEAADPAAAVALAGKVARDHALPVPEAMRLHESLAAVRAHPDLATLTGVALETPMAETFKWTATVLKAVLSRQISLQGQREEDFNAAAAKLPAELAVREHEFAAQPKVVQQAPLPA